MLKEFIEATLEWEWKSRIYVSSLILFIAILAYLLYGEIFTYGYVVAAVLLIMPFTFAEKHVDFDEESAEELVVSEFSLNSEELKSLFSSLISMTQKGFDLERSEDVLAKISNLPIGDDCHFNFYITTALTQTSLTIKAWNTGEFYLLEFTSNQELSDVLVNLELRVMP